MTKKQMRNFSAEEKTKIVLELDCYSTGSTEEPKTICTCL
jgi:hypothetical protein